VPKAAQQLNSKLTASGAAIVSIELWFAFVVSSANSGPADIATDPGLREEAAGRRLALRNGPRHSMQVSCVPILRFPHSR